MSATPLQPAPEPTGVSDDARPQWSHERGEEEQEVEEVAVEVEGRAGREQLHSGVVANVRDDDDDDAPSSLVSDLLPLEALPPAPSGSWRPQWPTNPDSELTYLGKIH